MCNFRDGILKSRNGIAKFGVDLGKTYSELACGNLVKSRYVVSIESYKQKIGAVWYVHTKVCEAVLQSGGIDGADKDGRSCYFDGIYLKFRNSEL